MSFLETMRPGVGVVLFFLGIALCSSVIQVKKLGSHRPLVPLRGNDEDKYGEANTFNIMEESILISGRVMSGYGRGSKKLGVPTANLPHFDKALTELEIQNGVYFGWASKGTSLSDNKLMPNEQIIPCVTNIGISPTFEGMENPIRIAEVHLIDFNKKENEADGIQGESSGSTKEATSIEGKESKKIGDEDDFYGDYLRVALIGFLRPEKKFENFEELVSQINQDVNNARRGCELFETYIYRQDLFEWILDSNRVWKNSIPLKVRIAKHVPPYEGEAGGKRVYGGDPDKTLICMHPLATYTPPAKDKVGKK